MRIVTLDPGGTTGYCYIRVSKEKLERFESGQIVGHDHHVELHSLLSEKMPHLIISESFEYRNRSRAGLVLVSKEYIGVAKLYAAHNGIHYLEQSPSQAMGFATDYVIRNLNWWKASKPHAMDAVRHMIYFGVNGNHDIETLREYILKFGFRNSKK